MSYRDMTFCILYKTCKHGKDCRRALTREIEDHAKQLGLHVAMFTTCPGCFDGKETDED